MEDSIDKQKSPWEILEEMRAAESVGGIGLTPEDAKKRLVRLGYTEDMWPAIIEEAKKGGSSHFVRALISVAQGSEPQKLTDVYKKLYSDEPHKRPFPEENLGKIINKTLDRNESKNELREKK